MIQRLCLTNNCGRKAQDGKHCFFHRPRKPLKPGKPMRKEAVKTRQKREATNRQWDAENPPDKNGQWECYLLISPYCHIWVDKKTLNREHTLSKARHPEEKYNPKKIKPGCPPCNKLKGSRSETEVKKMFREVIERNLIRKQETF